MLGVDAARVWVPSIPVPCGPLSAGKAVGADAAFPDARCSSLSAYGSAYFFLSARFIGRLIFSIGYFQTGFPSSGHAASHVFHPSVPLHQPGAHDLPRLDGQRCYLWRFHVLRRLRLHALGVSDYRSALPCLDEQLILGCLAL